LAHGWICQNIQQGEKKQVLAFGFYLRDTPSVHTSKKLESQT
jgi:hypothetical protein